MTDTIFALSSGLPPSGVAVIRISGPNARFAIETMCGADIESGRVNHSSIRHPNDRRILDRGLVLRFDAPHSFTGEDVVELQLHGGRAVVAATLDALAQLPQFRLALPGEFSRRAFENGKLDLTQIEGLADLIAADTEHQRALAISQAGGVLRSRCQSWLEDLTRARALVEAEIDFADEGDVPAQASAAAWEQVRRVGAEMAQCLADEHRGETVRDGFQVVLAGRPNAGKSSLLNALARRDVAIVTPEAGTTRDMLEVHLDLGGYPVTVTDTAGIRTPDGAIEKEAIRRGRARAAAADLVVWLWARDDPDGAPPTEATDHPNRKIVRSKADLKMKAADPTTDGYLAISVVDETGIQELVSMLGEAVASASSGGESGLIARARHRQCISDAARAIDGALADPGQALELRAEQLRGASEALERLIGKVDVEDLLGVIFAEFCVGK